MEPVTANSNRRQPPGSLTRILRAIGRSVFTAIRELASSRNMVARKGFSFVRRSVLRIYDPITTYSFEGVELLLNLSHELPLYRKSHPTYATNLWRLSDFIGRFKGALDVLDVGANIGDSYCLYRSDREDRYLLIEPDLDYYELLTHNTRGDSRVECVRALLGDTHTAAVEIRKERGTGWVVDKTAMSPPVDSTSLDALLERTKVSYRADLLKIDVDGYDARVLRGSKQLLQRDHPVIFFEHYPEMLIKAQEDPMQVFSYLAEVGYGRMLIYDNVGILVTEVAVTDLTTLHDFVHQARHRSTYFDICAFPRTSDALFEAFLAAERTFFQEYSAAP